MDMDDESDVERCVHCLRPAEAMEADHVFPDSWYPDTTAPTVQRWTAPSCPECNRKLGQLENDLLLRLILCIDPKAEAASGLASKALRSLGIDADELTEEEKAHRDKRKAKIRSEIMPRAEVVGKVGGIPGLEAQNDDAQWVIPIPWAGLSMIAEKIARGCEHRLRGRYVAPPYGVRTFISVSDFVAEPCSSVARSFDFGPGCRVRRVFATEDPNVVRYWITIWNTLYFTVLIGVESELKNAEPGFSKAEGILLKEGHGSMRIPPYLRTLC